MVITLTTEEIHEVLDNGRVARLGCIANGEPYVVPVNYDFRDGAIYCHSVLGAKISALRQNPRACIQVDETESDSRWRSALAFGNYEELKDESERQEVLALLLQKYPTMTPVEWGVVSDADTLDIIVFRINVDRMTGVSGY